MLGIAVSPYIFMSKKTRAANPQSIDEKEIYWMKRIVDVANRKFPEIIKTLNEMVEMANHGLTVESRRKLRVMIANDLGHPLSKLEIPNVPTKPNKKVVEDSNVEVRGTNNGESIAEGTIPDTTTTTSESPDNEKNEEHVRSSVLPDDGREDAKRAIDSSPD